MKRATPHTEIIRTFSRKIPDRYRSPFFAVYQKPRRNKACKADPRPWKELEMAGFVMKNMA